MIKGPPVYAFQTSCETIRAHHWRYHTDAYSGCSFNCQYCLYKGPDDYGAHVSVVDEKPAEQLDSGILNIGSSTDPYQPIDVSEGRTRMILERALESRTPVFLLTRGTGVLRDTDVLSDLAAQGLVEVCFSVITLNESISSIIEPRAPKPSVRLSTAEQVAGLGIPTTFHIAPLIPGMDSLKSMELLGQRLGEISRRHVFCAILGAQKAYWPAFQIAMKSAEQFCNNYEQFTNAYPEDLIFERSSSAVTCELALALPSIAAVKAGVVSSGATFVSENFPFLTSAPLEGGIYRWKLPTVYDMETWVREKGGSTSYADFHIWHSKFRPSLSLTGLAKELWDNGQLMSGTRLKRKDDSEGNVSYQYMGDYLAEAPRSTLVARRSKN